jgi:hypothetical protein
MDGSGFEPLLQLPNGLVSADRAGLGMWLFSPTFPGGPDLESQVTQPTLRYAQILYQTSWPAWTRVHCSDIGTYGSTWVFDGSAWFCPHLIHLSGNFTSRTDLPANTRVFGKDIGANGSYWRYTGSAWKSEGVITFDVATWSFRTDLPAGTRVFVSDLGAYGSYWSYNGGDWNLDSNAFPIGSITSEVIGMQRLLPQQTIRANWFRRPGRRFELKATVQRGFGTITAPKTELWLGGVPVLSIPWDSTMREQRIAAEFWTADAAGIGLGANANVITSSWALAPGATSTAVASQDTTAITNLTSAAQTLQFGIVDTAADNGNFALVQLQLLATA